MTARAPADNHGLVRPWGRDRAFVLESRFPSPALERLVDRHWIVHWDLRGREPFRQETLPQPSINLVLEPDGARVWGVPTRRDVRLLDGHGWAIGTKLKPGAFTAITGIDAALLTDTSVPVPDALGGAFRQPSLAGADGSLAMAVAEIEARLTPFADVDDPALELVEAVIETMRDIAPHARVDELAAKHFVAPRTLQRIFRSYVGVSPKWVLKRLRVHQALEQLVAGPTVPWTRLAHDLGYYDHAHFIRDFRLVVGRSPAEYLAEMQAASRN
jgi:AraC-like DNA-binding protein